MIAAKFLVEDATIYADQQPEGRSSFFKDILMGSVPGVVAIAIQNNQNKTYSWGPANIPEPLAELHLNWWKQNHANLHWRCFIL